MLQMTGLIVNTFTQEGGKNKDGEEYEARHKVQLLGSFVLPNGDTKQELVDLKVEDLSDWTPHEGKNITVDIGAYAPSKNNIVYSVKKGAKPQISVKPNDY